MASSTASTRPTSPVRIDVTSERGPYAVMVGTGLASSPEKTLKSLGLPVHALVVSAPEIWRRHGAAWRGVAGKRGPVLITDGEKAKTLNTVSRLYDAFNANALDRASMVVALGGGTIGDMTGFAAATYLRGLHVIQVPTTLLAQVDSAIGGKTGVNLPTGKNLVGSFHSPSAVICDPDVLGSLPRRDFRSGLYEVVKYGVIAAPSILETVTSKSHAIFACEAKVLTPLIAECCRIKAAVVTADERESGRRRSLNFGHTIGHALELSAHYALTHGEAISIGMAAATRLALQLGLCDALFQTRLEALLLRAGLPLSYPGHPELFEPMLRALQLDKKFRNGKNLFVLPTAPGAWKQVEDIPWPLVHATMQEAIADKPGA